MGTFRAQVATENMKTNTVIGDLRCHLCNAEPREMQHISFVIYLLEVYSSKHGAAHDTLEQSCGELKSMLDAHVLGHTEYKHSTTVQNIKKALDQEIRTMPDESEHATVYVGSLIKWRVSLSGQVNLR